MLKFNLSIPKIIIAVDDTNIVFISIFFLLAVVITFRTIIYILYMVKYSIHVSIVSLNEQYVFNIKGIAVVTAIANTAISIFPFISIFFVFLNLFIIIYINASNIIIVSSIVRGSSCVLPIKMFNKIIFV